MTDSDDTKNNSEYTDKNTVIICASAPEYSLYMTALGVFKFSHGQNYVEDLVVYVKEEKVYRPDFTKPSHELKNDLIHQRKKSPYRMQEDSNQYESKLDKVLNSDFLSRIQENLAEDDIEAVTAEFQDLFETELFPGSHVDVEIEIKEWQPEPSDEMQEMLDSESGDESQSGSDESTASSETDDAMDNIQVEVAPKVSPSTGTPIEQISIGEDIAIRLVGGAVEQLSDTVQRKKSGSRPMTGTLLKVAQGSSENEIQFIVKIDDDFWGIGSTPIGTLVHVPQRASRNNSILEKIEPDQVVMLIILLVAFGLVVFFFMYPIQFLNLIFP